MRLRETKGLARHFREASAAGVKRMRKSAPPSRTLVKKAMQDALMHGMKTAIAHLPENASDERRAAEEQFRRVERLFGYEPNSWPVGV